METDHDVNYLNVVCVFLSIMQSSFPAIKANVLHRIYIKLIEINVESLKRFTKIFQICKFTKFVNFSFGLVLRFLPRGEVYERVGIKIFRTIFVPILVQN